jgi:hypothetical protein
MDIKNKLDNFVNTVKQIQNIDTSKLPSGVDILKANSNIKTPQR